MRELYRKIGSLERSGDSELITVTRGALAGQKILLDAGVPVWSSVPVTEEEIGALGKDDCFRERLGRPRTMVICGAGFVGLALVKLGHFLGWHVICAEDREEYAGLAREAGADEVICAPFAEALASVHSDRDTFYVVVTREHEYDLACLDVILRGPFGYLGMMGSHRRTAQMREDLREQGIGEELIAKIHAPVGLPIGAQTPEEIAVSIMAQVIQEKELTEKESAYQTDILDEVIRLCAEDAGQSPAALATITLRKGSTPRKAGARMLVYRNGTSMGTVGGGSMEAKVIRTAAQMLADGAPGDWQLLTVDLTGRTGEYADMLCGGVTDVFLELL